MAVFVDNAIIKSFYIFLLFDELSNYLVMKKKNTI